MANGRSQRVDSATVEGDVRRVLVRPAAQAVRRRRLVLVRRRRRRRGRRRRGLPSGPRRCPRTGPRRGTVTIGITTMNRQDFCAKLLTQLGEADQLEEILDEVVVMEQGKDKVVDSEYFPEAEKSLGDRLRIIEQGNIGGSGGFARAQYEGLKAGRSKYVMMLDDDVECETEGVAARGHLRRPVPQDDHRRRPHVQHLPEDPAPLLRGAGLAVHLLVGLGARRVRRLGLRRPQPALHAAGCTPASTWTTTAGSCA